ncbi:GmrSD restriction endonuclease domain-containing protein, partial [Acinetobacter baumannii]|uniref:GmrSD restriction endonuclease domain-containing protein n=1 Tax=Acinetobacter baumannii TaxID=470 RepID=UPI0024B72EBA
VLHRNPDSDSDENIDIVDGQQRTLTLMLLVWAVIQKQELDLEREYLKTALNEISNQINVFMDGQKFNSDISHYNIYQNFNAAKRIVSVNFSEQDIDFLLNNCQVAVFILDDVSEAFQFFDSQNARGRDLVPYDLLNTYHLREFSA